MDDGGGDAGQRAAHRAGADIHDVVVRDHDPAGLGLPPVVVDVQFEHFFAPDHRLGVERFAHAGREAQVAQVVDLKRFDVQAHQPADGGGRGVPDGDLLVLQDTDTSGRRRTRLRRRCWSHRAAAGR